MKSFRVFALSLALAIFVGFPTLTQAQDESGPSAAVTTSLAGLHNITMANIMKTAELLEEDLYAYRPSEDVRTVGQILAHIANAQYMFCSAASGTENPSQVNLEETATTKEDIVAALQGSFDFCGGVYANMSDASGAEPKTVFGMQTTGSGILAFNSAHNYEHYGNLVTYMRMNGIVPPSSM